MTELIKYMQHARVTFIGCDSISEQKVDEIISTFCDHTHFIDFTDSASNITALMRDLRIHQIVNMTGHVVVDTTGLIKDDLRVLYGFLRQEDLPFKVIVKTPMYCDISRAIRSYKFKGGNQLLYEAQFAFTVIEDQTKVVKNHIYSYLPKTLWDKKEYDTNDN